LFIPSKEMQENILSKLFSFYFLRPLRKETSEDDIILSILFYSSIADVDADADDDEQLSLPFTQILQMMASNW